MYRWVQRIHMYAGLLTFTAFVVWGVAGIESVFLPAPGEWAPPEVAETVEVPFEAPGDLDDKALAERIKQALAPPMTGNPALVARNADGNLEFKLFSPNGRRDVVYLEDRDAVRMENRRVGLPGYLSWMHAASRRRSPDAAAAKAWGLYNEISLWAFVFMTFSGVYLWLATRSRMRWAWWTSAAGAAVFAALWFAVR